MHWVTRIVLRTGSVTYLFEAEHSKILSVVCESKHLVLGIVLFELETPANDRAFLGDVDRQAEMSVRVWKGGLMVEPL